jgi:kynureninase
MKFTADRDCAVRLDRVDPLAACRDRFHLPRGKHGDAAIYLCGNSLGLQPLRTAEYLHEELEDWRNLAVRGHFEARRPWMPYHEFLAEKAARLVGALPSEVVTMNSLTVNLHLMMVSFYRPTAERPAILIERGAFPSDRYAVESQIRFHGYDPATALLEIGPREGEAFVRDEDIAAMFESHGERIALALLPGVQYYSGQVFNMAAITRMARASGCTVGFDLAHAVGNVPLALHDWAPDFAVWCNYKYVNGGPGALAGCFVHERHADNPDLPRFAGWWGHDKDSRFRMGPDFVPMQGAEGWQLSNPPILAMAPVLASLDIFDEVGMPALREKSLQLTGYLDYLLRERLGSQVEILTPADAGSRGCQLSLQVTVPGIEGKKVFERLEAADVICDWREPAVIRVAPVPLYNSYMDVYRFVDSLAEALA